MSKKKGEKKKKKPHIIPHSVVFPEDSNEDKEDTRPIEKRKKPKRSFLYPMRR